MINTALTVEKSADATQVSVLLRKIESTDDCVYVLVLRHHVVDGMTDVDISQRQANQIRCVLVRVRRHRSQIGKATNCRKRLSTTHYTGNSTRSALRTFNRIGEAAQLRS